MYMLFCCSDPLKLSIIIVQHRLSDRYSVRFFPISLITAIFFKKQNSLSYFNLVFSIFFNISKSCSFHSHKPLKGYFSNIPFFELKLIKSLSFFFEAILLTRNIRNLIKLDRISNCI